MRHLSSRQFKLFSFKAVPIIQFQVDSAFYSLWDGKVSTSQKAVMLCGQEGNRRLDRK